MRPGVRISPFVRRSEVGSFAGLALIIVLASPDAVARPKGSGRAEGAVAPAAFGRIFEANRRALVRVLGRPSPERERWETGFVIGAEGEFVFGAEAAPSARLRVRTEDGREHGAELLGYERAFALAVGRLDAGRKSGSEIAPLHVAAIGELRSEQWVVILKHDSSGRPEPFAGVVDGDASPDASRRSPFAIRVARVSVPSSPGSPVLSLEGDLVGVAIEGAERRTRVVTIGSLAPFLKAVVLRGTD